MSIRPDRTTPENSDAHYPREARKGGLAAWLKSSGDSICDAAAQSNNRIPFERALLQKQDFGSERETRAVATAWAHHGAAQTRAPAWHHQRMNALQKIFATVLALILTVAL